MESTYLIGDVFEQLATLPSDSVDLVLTSPPFLALRSYLPDDHPDKGNEIGQEPTPAAFLDTLLALTAEWDRVLAPHGSLCVELGDTYSGSGGAGGDYSGGGQRDGQAKFTGSARRRSDEWPLAKSLCMIPELYAASLAYGRNLLTGTPSPAGSWRVRNGIKWVRPNPPVGALGDKFRPASSLMTVACRSKDRWFDLEAVRESLKYPEAAGPNAKTETAMVAGKPRQQMSSGSNPAGAPPLDWWEIPSQPYKGSHYAVWPRQLLVRPILAMCPQHVCQTCGEPRRRIVDSIRYLQDGTIATGDFMGSKEGGINQKNAIIKNWAHTDRTTVGWTDCGHNNYRRGIVLDPFAGSGTTLAVANGLGRDAIGIDLDARNADLARDRCGMFLTVHGDD